jgi:hypothetical protein
MGKAPMRFSAQIVLWLSIAFAVFCIAYAVVGFSSIDPSLTAQEREDSRGYAIFFLCLGAFGVVAAVVSWLMMRGKLGGKD